MVAAFGFGCLYWLHQWGVLRGRYKVAAAGFGFSFWLHQGRIPHRYCRFHCCLAAHQRTRKKDSAEPSFPILWTPPHPPGVIRCGGVFWLPRLTGISDSGIRCRFLIPTSIYRLGALCSGCGRLRFSRVVGLVSFVFHWWGRSFVPAGTWGLAMVFRRICADREWVGNMADNGEGNL